MAIANQKNQSIVKLKSNNNKDKNNHINKISDNDKNGFVVGRYEVPKDKREWRGNSASKKF